MYALRDGDFEDLRLGRGFRRFSLNGRHDAHTHIGAGTFRTRDHKALARHIDRKLHAGINVGGNGHEISLCGTAGFFGLFIDSQDIFGHGNGATPALARGICERRRAQQEIIGDKLGRQRDLQRLSRSTGFWAFDTHAAGTGMHGKLRTGAHALGYNDTVDLGGAGGRACHLIGTGAIGFGFAAGGTGSGRGIDAGTLDCCRRRRIGRRSGGGWIDVRATKDGWSGDGSAGR